MKVRRRIKWGLAISVPKEINDTVGCFFLNKKQFSERYQKLYLRRIFPCYADLDDPYSFVIDLRLLFYDFVNAN